MKTAIITSTLALLLLGTSAAPAPIKIDLSAVDFDKIDYPKGTGEKLSSYPAPSGGWGSVHYGGKDDKNDKYKSSPFKFTSFYQVTAVPSQVVNGTTPTGGLPGAKAYLSLGVNSEEDYVCYSIKLVGFQGEYRSPAKTATHIHEGAKGASGPPRFAFQNPEGTGEVRYSRGCLSAPYTTGVNTTAGVDTGAGFSAKQIEANPSGFFFDIHSSLATPGAVRGQLA